VIAKSFKCTNGKYLQETSKSDAAVDRITITVVVVGDDDDDSNTTAAAAAAVVLSASQINPEF